MEKVIQPLSTPEPETPEGAEQPHVAQAAPQAHPTQPNPSHPDRFPIGVSASSLGINTASKGASGHGKLIKKLLVIAVVIALAVGGGLFVKNAVSGLSTQTLSNGGYTYSFKFFKPANAVQLSNGSNAYKHLDDVIGAVSPSKAPALTSCSQIGSKWTEAFKVNVDGSDVPVCTPNQSSYSLYFTALDHRHLFTVTYKDAQKVDDVQPKLKQIFESVSVTQ